jgi:probable F420-dependent oxidoreductase
VGGRRGRDHRDRAVRLGVLYQADEDLPPHELGRLLEARGVESIWFPEHTHIPAARATTYPGPGGRLADIYRRFPDPLVCLAAVAAVTERLVLGTGVVLITQRDPILLAKEVATLDRIAGGRVELGVGAGWNDEELRNHGTDPAHRFGVMRERVRAVRAIWTQEEASFSGSHVSFDAIWCGPKPLRLPPILIAGDGPKVLDRVLAYGDGWAVNQRFHDDAVLIERVRELQERAGRPVPVTLFSAPLDGELLRRYADAGVTRAVLSLRPTPHDPVDLTRLDAMLELMEGVPA